MKLTIAILTLLAACSRNAGPTPGDDTREPACSSTCSVDVYCPDGPDACICNAPGGATTCAVDCSLQDPTTIDCYAPSSCAGLDPWCEPDGSCWCKDGSFALVECHLAGCVP